MRVHQHAPAEERQITYRTYTEVSDAAGIAAVVASCRELVAIEADRLGRARARWDAAVAAIAARRDETAAAVRRAEDRLAIARAAFAQERELRQGEHGLATWVPTLVAVGAVVLLVSAGWAADGAGASAARAGALAVAGIVLLLGLVAGDAVVELRNRRRGARLVLAASGAVAASLAIVGSALAGRESAVLADVPFAPWPLAAAFAAIWLAGAWHRAAGFRWRIHTSLVGRRVALMGAQIDAGRARRAHGRAEREVAACPGGGPSADGRICAIVDHFRGEALRRHAALAPAGDAPKDADRSLRQLEAAFDQIIEEYREDRRAA